MPDDGSVTHWIAGVRGGDPAAAERLWERFFPRLDGLARARLRGTARLAADEEDVALSALDSFCRRAGAGQYPHLADRDDLWRLLVVITARKAGHLVRDQSRQRRGGAARPDSSEPTLEGVLSRDPTPEFAAQVAEEYRRLMAALGDPEVRAVARMRMEGSTVEEIARETGYSPRSIKRKLHLIRGRWGGEVVGGGG
jgi:DNA-directed RNA polymerase specialized sigma24 family protein